MEKFELLDATSASGDREISTPSGRLMIDIWPGYDCVCIRDGTTTIRLQREEIPVLARNALVYRLTKGALHVWRDDYRRLIMIRVAVKHPPRSCLFVTSVARTLRFISWLPASGLRHLYLCVRYPRVTWRNLRRVARVMHEEWRGESMKLPPEFRDKRRPGVSLVIVISEDEAERSRVQGVTWDIPEYATRWDKQIPPRFLKQAAPNAKREVIELDHSAGLVDAGERGRTVRFGIHVVAAVICSIPLTAILVLASITLFPLLPFALLLLLAHCITAALVTFFWLIGFSATLFRNRKL